MNWARPFRIKPLLHAAACLMIWMSWSGCRAPRVLSAEQMILRVEARQPFVAPCDGWFLSDALYHRTRRAVADRILELETQPPSARP